MNEIVDNVRRIMLDNRIARHARPAVVLVWPYAPEKPTKFESDEGIVFLIHPDVMQHIMRDAEPELYEPRLTGGTLLGVPVFNYTDDSPDVKRARWIMQAALEKASQSFFERGGTF